MNRFLNNLQTQPDGNKRHPAVHIMFFVTMVFGFGFLFLGGTDAVSAVVLHTQLIEAFGSFGPVVWGAIASGVSLLNYRAILRGVCPGKTVSFIGFMLWFFAMMALISAAGWFTLFAVALPSVWFWGWYYLAILNLENMRKHQARLEKGKHDE